MELFLIIVLLCLFFVFVLPLIQGNYFNRVTRGTIIATQVKSYSDSYGRRYTRKIFTYEFQDEQGRTWRGQVKGNSVQNLPEGSSIKVYYQENQPSQNRGDLSEPRRFV